MDIKDKKIKGIVYKASSPSGKVYIGITITSLKERMRMHLRSVNNGSNFPFHNAIRKYKMENIKWMIIDTAETWKKLCKLEMKYIDEFDSYNKLHGYNCTKGGEGTFGFKPTKEHREKTSLSVKNYYKNPKNRKKNSLAITNYYKNPENREKHVLVMNNLEYKKKQSLAAKDLFKNPEYREKHAIGNGAKLFNVFKNNEFVGEWLTQRGCARDLNLGPCSIHQCLKGKQKSHKGYTFRYKK